MTDNYLNSVRHQFHYYKNIGEQAMAQLTDADLFWQYDTESNSIATIIKHLEGNMLSRWTDFLHTDGEKPNRNRDAEFESEVLSRETLLQKWEAGWQCLFAAIDTMQTEDLLQVIYIRQQAHTVVEALNRQLAHYPYHIGQIVLIAKMLKNEAFTSLSIPKGHSQAFNQNLMQPKQP